MNKKHLFTLIIFVSLLMLSAANAAEYDADDSISINDNELILEETISEELILEDNNNEEIALDESNEAVLSQGDESLSFTDLNNAINGNEDEEIHLNNNYTFNSDSDSNFANGININRNLTIYGNGFTLNGNNQARIFNITAEKVNLKNIIFINGHSEGNGGAIFINGSFANSTINSTFINNSAKNGGAIYINGASEDNVICGEFRDNIATNCGGGIYLWETSTRNNFTAEFYNNTANAEKSGGGIFFHNASSNDYFESIFMYNKAMYGAGIFFYYEVNNDIFNSDFRYNVAGSCGGAIFFHNRTNHNTFKGTYINNTGLIGNGGSITFKDVSENSLFECDFINNTAGDYGGAVNYRESPKNITFNTNFINNTAKYGGGVNFFENFDNVVFNGEFIGNNATYGGGIAAKGGKIENTRFANNFANEGGAVFMNGTGTVVNCTFENNCAENGGALYESNATNCTFTNNTAKKTGGAVYGGVIDNCTFELNFAGNAGTENYDESLTTATNCTAVIIDLVCSDINTTYGLNEKLPFNLKNSEGKNYDGYNVSIDIYQNGKPIGTYSGLSGDGWIVDLDSGVYDIRLSVKNSNISPKNIKLTVNQRKTVIDAAAITSTYNINKNLIITLKDSQGKALIGVQVTVKIGSSTKAYKTDKNGQVKVNVAKLVPKTYTAKISFTGDVNYKASSKSVKVVVNKAKAKLTAKKKTFKRKVKVKKYTVTLKNNKGKAIKKVQLTLKVKGKTVKAKTNNKGKAVFKIKNLKKKGTFKAVIKFKGNKYYKKLSKKVKIRVK